MRVSWVTTRSLNFILTGVEDKNVLYNVCWFLLYNKVNQLLYIHPHPLEPPSNPAPIPPLQVITDRWQDLILSGKSVSCRPVCNPIDCSPLGSSVHGIFQVKCTRVGSHFLFQGIFLTQGSNLGLLHCRQILHHLSHQGRIMIKR